MTREQNRVLCDNLVHNLIVLRKRHGLSQRAMAGILGISVRSLRVLEQGERLPNVDIRFLDRARRYFGVPLETLFHTRL